MPGPRTLFEYALALKQGRVKQQQIPPSLLIQATKLSRDLNPTDFTPSIEPKKTGKPQPRSAIRKVRRA